MQFNSSSQISEVTINNFSLFEHMCVCDDLQFHFFFRLVIGKIRFLFCAEFVKIMFGHMLLSSSTTVSVVFITKFVA